MENKKKDDGPICAKNVNASMRSAALRAIVEASIDRLEAAIMAARKTAPQQTGLTLPAGTYALAQALAFKYGVSFRSLVIQALETVIRSQDNDSEEDMRTLFTEADPEKE